MKKPHPTKQNAMENPMRVYDYYRATGMKPSRLRAKLDEDWWWRDERRRTDLLLKSICLHGKDADRAAWLYELARRGANVRKLPPFYKLPEELANQWVEYFGAHRDAGRMTHRSTGIWNLIAAPGWTRPAPIEWNLHAPFHQLARDFKMFIDMERWFQEIRPTRGPKGKATRNKGRKNRPFSWAWPELMDRADAKEKLNNSERSSLSEARKAARAFLAAHPVLQEVFTAVEKRGNKS
jgi:hypothetical protein